MCSTSRSHAFPNARHGPASCDVRVCSPSGWLSSSGAENMYFGTSKIAMDLI